MTISPLLNDRDPDGDPIRLLSISGPRHGTATMTASTVTYTASALPAGHALTVDVITYTIGDTQGSLTTANIRFEVKPPTPMPVTGHNTVPLTRAALLALLAGTTLYWLAGRPHGRHRA